MNLYESIFGEPIQSCSIHTVDGRTPAPIGSISHWLQSFLHPRWCTGCLPSIISLQLAQTPVFLTEIFPKGTP